MDFDDILDYLKERFDEGEITLQDIDEAVARCSLIDPLATDNAVNCSQVSGHDY